MRLSVARFAGLAVGLSLCLAGPALAHEAGDWLLRVGVSTVDPKSDNLDTDLGMIEVDSGTTLTFTGSYFFTENWGLELLAAAPFNHDIELEGLGKIAEADHLPPTLSLQYHFLPDGAFQPYVGAGLNATIFFSEDVEAGVAGVLGASTVDLELDSSFGLAAQAGADFVLNEKWVLNVEVRWIDIDAEAELIVDGAEVDLGDVEIDPWVYGINLGYRF